MSEEYDGLIGCEECTGVGEGITDERPDSIREEDWI